MTVCRYDSGSMDDCKPLCNWQAAHVVVHRNGSSGPFETPVCGRHLKPMLGGVFPGHIETRELCRAHRWCRNREDPAYAVATQAKERPGADLRSAPGQPRGSPWHSISKGAYDMHSTSHRPMRGRSIQTETGCIRISRQGRNVERRRDIADSRGLR